VEGGPVDNPSTIYFYTWYNIRVVISQLKNMKIHKIAFCLLIIGGLNWLLVGLISGWDLGVYITPVIARIVYILVGLSALYEVFTHKQNCKHCEAKMGGQQM